MAGGRDSGVRFHFAPVRESRQRTKGIGCGQTGHFRATAAAQAGERLSDACRLGGSVSSRMQPGWRNIGCIGLKHQRLRRKFARQPADTKSALKGHRPAKPEHTTLAQKRSGLL